MSKGPNSSIRTLRFSDNIVSSSCMERTKGNSQPLDRVDITTDNPIALSNEVRSCYKGVIGLMWKGSMPPLP